MARAQKQPSGDAALAAELAALLTQRTGNVAVAAIDLNGEIRSRMAFVGADATSRFEIGSVTKALTGMLLADAIDRREVALATTIADVLPDHAGPGFGSVTLKELCTHTSGLPRVPADLRFTMRALGHGLFGTDPYRGTDPARLVELAARQPLRERGRHRYSNLGGAVVGQVLAAVAGMEYPALLAERLLAPLGMSRTSVAVRGDTAARGHAVRGGRPQPWILDAYAPAGGVISIIGDLSFLAIGLLDGTAPGRASLESIPGVDTARPGRDSGMFWVIEPTAGSGGTMIWHNGRTGGYAAFLVLYPRAGQAVVVLADLADAAESRRIALGITKWLDVND